MFDSLLLYILGFPSQPTELPHICDIYSTFAQISAECSFDDSTATGFQMIAQLSNYSEVHRLYASKTIDRQTSASVVVEESGLYRVTIFPIREGTGITNSSVEFITQLAVSDTTTGSALTTESAFTTLTATKPSSTAEPTTADIITVMTLTLVTLIGMP